LTPEPAGGATDGAGRIAASGQESEMSWSEIEHSYEELRETVIAILLDAGADGADRFEKLLERTALELHQHDAESRGRQPPAQRPGIQLNPSDAELVLDIVWDLFRQGIVTLGKNAANPGWPWLRLSRFGESALQQGPYRVHNKAGFVKALRSEAPDISSDAMVYYREAVAAFYMDCLLSACVMLSIAAESELLRLIAVAKASEAYGPYFSRIGDGLTIRTKIVRFQDAVRPLLALLPKAAIEELDNNLNIMQSLLRLTRTESGQPFGVHPPSRDHVFVYLQLFIPFAAQIAQIRRQLSEPARPRLVHAT
jgi:hypothetical protein